MKTFTLFTIFILVVSFVFVPGVLGAGSSTSTSSRSSDVAIVTDKQVEKDNETEAETRSSERLRHKDRAEVISGLLKALNASDKRSDRAKFVLSKLYECDQVDNRTERIACRLEIRKVAKNNTLDEVEEDFERNETRIPEVCLKLSDRQDCKKLYRAANHCYELDDGREKDRCFKRIAGFVKAKIKDHEDDNERKDKTRKYLVYLLYELQERIEHKAENGEISEDDAARLIEQIVIIKEDLLNKEPKSVIKPKLQTLRQDFKSVMENDEEDEDE